MRWIALALALLVSLPLPAAAQRARTHVVREGDTLARIARRYRSSIGSIQQANELRGDRLRLGQRLIVPRAGEDPRTLRAAGSSSREREPSRAERQARARAARLDLGSVRTGQRLLGHPPERRWMVAAGSGRMRGTLRLPVDGGRLIRGWGSGEGGYHLAIDIRGPIGTTIRAVERGIVAYAGDAIPGYGNFVLIVHPNGWVSAYAHNRENLVVAGETVRRGDPIGRLGSTGRSQAPHLHFMLIHGGTHCDALPLFDPPLARRAARAVWRGARAPDAVQCLARSARPHPTRGRRAEAPGAETAIPADDDDSDLEGEAPADAAAPDAPPPDEPDAPSPDAEPAADG